MKRVGPCLILAFAIALALVGLAFLVAPRACSGGLAFYFWCGVAAVCVWLALPFMMRVGRSLFVRLALAFCLAAVGTGVWLTGLLAANVRFLCGLGYL